MRLVRRLRSFTAMTPARHNFWDITIKAVTTVALFIGGIWALYQHFDTEKKKVYSIIWNKRVELYFETSKSTGAIAVANSPNEVTKEIKDFWQAFYGPMSVIEDDAVKKKMEDFAGFVRAFQGPGYTSVGATTKPVPTEHENLSPEVLHKKKKDSAMALAEAMHISIKQSWSNPFNR